MSTRAKLRRDIGANLGALSPLRGTTTTGNTPPQVNIPAGLANTSLGGAYLWYNDQVAVATSPVKSSTTSGVTTYYVEIAPDFTGVTAGEDVEIWNPKYPPNQVNDYINQAIEEAANGAYVSQIDLEYCTSWRNKNIDLPSTFNMVNGVYRRNFLDYTPLFVQPTGFKQSTGSGVNVTISQDSEDYQYNPSSRIEADSAGDWEAEADVTLSNLAGMTDLEGWVKSSIDLTAGAAQIGLDQGGTTTWVNLPALTAREWTYLQIKFAAPEALTAVDGIHVKVTGATANAVFWVNGLWAVSVPSIRWQRIPNEHWLVESGSRTLQVGAQAPMLAYGVASWFPPHSVIRVSGGRDPSLMTADDDTAEIDPWFIVCRATELGFSPASGGRDTDFDQLRQQVNLWAQRAMIARMGFPILENVTRIG